MTNREDDELSAKLRILLNSESRESASDTPDYLLAEFILRCLKAYENAVKERDQWFNFRPWSDTETL